MSTSNSKYKTRIEALKAAILLWEYISKNPLSTKSEAYPVLGLQKDIHYCPLCDFTQDIDGYVNCIECPVWSSKRRGDTPCSLSHSSPYRTWIIARDEGYREIAALAAKKVLSLMRMRLGKEEKEERKGEKNDTISA